MCCVQYKPLKNVYFFFLLVFSLSLQTLNTFNIKGCGKVKWKEESIHILDVIPIQICNRKILDMHTHMYTHTHTHIY